MTAYYWWLNQKNLSREASAKWGFTLIELLAVIVIIGILASLALVGLNSVRTKARDTKRISDIRQLQSALEMYKNDNGVYSDFATSGTALVANGQTYMARIPTAPNKADGTCATDIYNYTNLNSGANYTVSYCLGGVVNNVGPGNCIAKPNIICDLSSGQYIVTSSPRTMTDDATVGTQTWGIPDNALASNDIYTTVSFSYAISHYLKATDFRFEIPTGATINGILVEFERKASSANYSSHAVDSQVKIVKADGTIGTANKAYSGATRWPTTEAYFPYGSSSDLWNEEWDSAKINDVDFGVVLSVITCPNDTGNVVTCSVDHIRITVYYTY